MDNKILLSCGILFAYLQVAYGSGNVPTLAPVLPTIRKGTLAPILPTIPRPKTHAVVHPSTQKPVAHHTTHKPAVHPTTPKPTIHQTTHVAHQTTHKPIVHHTSTKPTAKPTREPPVNHVLYFHYNRWSLEHLLIAQSNNDCFCMPLTSKDVVDTQNPAGLSKLEGILMTQIGKKLYQNWTNDDLAVRDGTWGSKCKGKIYRVYRI